MSEVGSAETTDPLKAVADAMEAAVQAAKSGAADARETAEKAFPVAANMLAKLAYNACYSLSYGVVFPTMLLARSVPKNNAVVHGFMDGAKAAVDMVDEMKSTPVDSEHHQASATGVVDASAP